MGGLIGAAGKYGWHMGAVDHVAIGVVLDAKTERIAPVVEYLAAEQMAADAAIEGVTMLGQIIVAGHDGVEILNFE